MKLSSSTERILSLSEQLVLQLISEGCSIDEISVMLMLSQDTIEILKQNINKKLGTHDMAEAIPKARSMNLI
jgi:DNA-binding NarL/FixJ family response regulator